MSKTGCSIRTLQAEIRSFCAERDWLRHHTPKNLALALAGEVGELCHCYRWEQDGSQSLFPSDAERGEVADVLWFALRMCDELGIDPAEVIRDKMKATAARYPPLTPPADHATLG